MTNRPFIKICGITQREDLTCVCAHGVDAVGFIAYPKSPRYVSPSKVKRFLDRCDTKGCLKVAVFVNASLVEVNEYLDAGIDVVQLHGDETAEYASLVKAEVWKAVRLYEGKQIDRYKRFPCSKFLIDSFVENAEIPGGSGLSANWPLATQFTKETEKDVLLAGGINEYNVAEALKVVNPFGVDLSSGLEKHPGVKDHQKIRTFFDKVNCLSKA